MVEVVIDSATLQTIVVALIPLVAYVITYLKNKLGNSQGDMAFTQMKSWAKQLADLAVVIPEIKDISNELTETVEHANALWNEPEDNSGELAQVFAHATILYSRAMDLIIKYTKAKEVKI